MGLPITNRKTGQIFKVEYLRLGSSLLKLSMLPYPPVRRKGKDKGNQTKADSYSCTNVYENDVLV